MHVFLWTLVGPVVSSWCRPTFEYSHGCGEVVDSSRSSEGGGDDSWRRNEIVGEGIVEIALEFEDILDLIEFFLVSGEGGVRDCMRKRYDCANAEPLSQDAEV